MVINDNSGGVMMKVVKVIRNFLLYCGIEKDEYNAIKKDFYVSNFVVWRILHFLMIGVSGSLFFSSLFNELLKQNSIFYLVLFIYSIVAAVFFFILKKESIFAQFLIYLSISMLFLFGCFITQNKPETPATTFIVLLILTPMFMLDKPIFMTIELIISSVVFLVWMYNVKTYDVFVYDLINVLSYMIVGIFIHLIANSIRVREFVLTRKINIQKDLDDLTSLKNKGALTREINEYLLDNTKNKGIMILLDIDHFKSINDTYGHDIGDKVIGELGDFLSNKFTKGEIIGRFGGDEFIIFIKDSDDSNYASIIANEINNETIKTIKVPDEDKIVSVSLGIAIYRGEEKNYSEIFKKADIALYKTKEKRNGYSIYQ